MPLDSSGIQVGAPNPDQNYAALMGNAAYAQQQQAVQQASLAAVQAQYQNAVNNLYASGGGFGQQTNYYSQLGANYAAAGMSPYGVFSGEGIGGVGDAAYGYGSLYGTGDAATPPSSYGYGGDIGGNYTPPSYTPPSYQPAYDYGSLYGGGGFATPPSAYNYGSLYQPSYTPSFDPSLYNPSTYAPSQDLSAYYTQLGGLYGGLGGTGYTPSPSQPFDYSGWFGGGLTDPFPGMAYPGGLNQPMAQPQPQPQPQPSADTVWDPWSSARFALSGEQYGSGAGGGPAPSMTYDQMADAFRQLGGSGAVVPSFDPSDIKVNPVPGMAMPGGLGQPMTTPDNSGGSFLTGLGGTAMAMPGGLGQPASLPQPNVWDPWITGGRYGTGAYSEADPFTYGTDPITGTEFAGPYGGGMGAGGLGWGGIMGAPYREPVQPNQYPVSGPQVTPSYDRYFDVTSPFSPRSGGQVTGAEPAVGPGARNYDFAPMFDPSGFGTGGADTSQLYGARGGTLGGSAFDFTPAPSGAQDIFSPSAADLAAGAGARLPGAMQDINRLPPAADAGDISLPFGARRGAGTQDLREAYPDLPPGMFTGDFTRPPSNDLIGKGYPSGLIQRFEDLPDLTPRTEQPGVMDRIYKLINDMISTPAGASELPGGARPVWGDVPIPTPATPADIVNNRFFFPLPDDGVSPAAGFGGAFMPPRGAEAGAQTETPFFDQFGGQEGQIGPNRAWQGGNDEPNLPTLPVIPHIAGVSPEIAKYYLQDPMMNENQRAAFEAFPGSYTPQDQQRQLQQDRAPFANQLEASPNAMKTLAAMAKSEIGLAPGTDVNDRQIIGFLETAANKYSSQGIDAFQTDMKAAGAKASPLAVPGTAGDYYAPARPGGDLQTSLDYMDSHPEELAKYVDLIRNVFHGGTNLSGLGFENASIGVRLNTTGQPTAIDPNALEGYPIITGTGQYDMAGKALNTQTLGGWAPDVPGGMEVYTRKDRPDIETGAAHGVVGINNPAARWALDRSPWQNFTDWYMDTNPAQNIPWERLWGTR